MSNQSSWVGVDLDGTLAVYDGWKGINHIGRPVLRVMTYVKQLLAYGVDVRIFTARCQEGQEAIDYINLWTVKTFGQVLPVTDRKDFGMVMMIDDRAFRVNANEGTPGDSTLPLPKQIAKDIVWHWSVDNPHSPTFVEK